MLCATLQFHTENITPAADGSWTVALAAAGGGTSPPFSDSTDLLKGSADDTKLLRFEIDGFTGAFGPHEFTQVGGGH